VQLYGLVATESFLFPCLSATSVTDAIGIDHVTLNHTPNPHRIDSLERGKCFCDETEIHEQPQRMLQSMSTTLKILFPRKEAAAV
jgi:hypothetical protein